MNMPVEPLRAGDPTRIGPYRLLGRIGCGGQGCVYLGKAPGGREVAVKALHVGGADDGAARRRFARGLRAARAVPAEHTAVVYEADLDGDLPYMVIEYIDGPSLQQAVEGRGPIAGTPLRRLATQMATAMVAIHEAGVVHRDLKPANVLLGPDGARVVDFGIAQAAEATALQSSVVMGTFAYMAPEQFGGEPAGPAADVFAWAATVVFAATGRPPYGEGGNVAAVIHRIIHDQPDLGALAGPLRSIVLRCLAKRPAERPTAWWVLQAMLARGAVPAAAPPAAGKGGTGGDVGAAGVPPLRVTVGRAVHVLDGTRPYTVGGHGCTIEVARLSGELLYLRYRGAWMVRVRIPDADIRVEGGRRHRDTFTLAEPGARGTISAYVGEYRVTCKLDLETC
ncbi:serine/threonine-protein kinase [Sphaerisporangium aureirubrum]|uniref:Serine/threonine-protein kinase n=1 Tax=Sphaerisporangium aureirubrum TaxID=1544736 RepID=A0ABW1N9C0_9ACTN